MFRFPTLMCPVILFAAALAAQPAPVGDTRGDGAWKLVPEKSDFGPQQPPLDGYLVLKIKSNGPEFVVEQVTSERTERYVFRSDGKETTNPLPDGGELKGRYAYENGALVGELSLGEGAIVFKDRISYSVDYQFMTLDRQITGPEPGKMKLVMERMPAEHPSMAGFWKLDGKKSDFGGAPTPAKYEAKITVDGHVFSMIETTDGKDSELKLRDDGQETTNEISGMTMKSKMQWEKGVLVGESTYTGNGVEMTFKDRTSFSPDGKLMTTDRVGQTPNGERKMHIVMVKQ
jgi:hypothetical protein